MVAPAARIGPKGRNLIRYGCIGVEKDILLSILGVRREYLETSFKTMLDQFGSIEAYFFRGMTISPARQQALREQFVKRR